MKCRFQRRAPVVGGCSTRCRWTDERLTQYGDADRQLTAKAPDAGGWERTQRNANPRSSERLERSGRGRKIPPLHGIQEVAPNPQQGQLWEDLTLLLSRTRPRVSAELSTESRSKPVTRRGPSGRMPRRRSGWYLGGATVSSDTALPRCGDKASLPIATSAEAAKIIGMGVEEHGGADD
jgi:hypothetical protein